MHSTPRFRNRTGLARLGATLVILSSRVGSPGATGPAGGGGAPVATEQPSIELRYLICTYGLYAGPGSSGSGPGEDIAMAGEIQLFAANFTPGGWHDCDGALLSVSEYETLFATIGTTYGGDGVNTFGIPDLRGRIPIGYDAAHPIGSASGAATVTLNASQLPAHAHALPGGDTGYTGGGAPVDLSQPSLALNYMIATGGQFDYMADVRLFAFSHELQLWKRCDGRSLPINQNQALFAWLGTSYGGDGNIRFSLPDLRGRTVIGAGQGTGLTNRPFATTVGQNTVTLTEDQLPPHTHSLQSGSTGSAGQSQPINQLQASVAMPLFITDVGVYPSVSGAQNPFIGSVHFRAVTGNRLTSRIEANGEFLTRGANDPLRSIIGYSFGGAGASFNLPDCRGRAIKGTVGATVGTLAGSETLTLTTAQMPAHTHESGPGAQTFSADYIMAREATLYAWVVPHGLSTTAQFQHGLTATYGGVLPITLEQPAGETGQWIGLRLKNLTPLTTYHYRVVATNAEGTTTGSDVSFTTRSEVPQKFYIDTGGIHFGAAVAGFQTPASRITVRNTGDFPLALTGLSLTGGNLPDDFTITHDPLPPTLPPGDSFEVFIRFSPRHTGDRNTVLRWTSNDPSLSSFDVSLMGTATNKTPVVINGGLPDQQMKPSSTAPLRFDLRSLFIDPDGHVLTFEVVHQTNTAVANGSIAGNVLTVNSLAAGNAVIQVRASDPYGASVDFAFPVQVGSITVPAQGAGFSEVTRTTLFPDGQWLEWVAIPGHKYRVEWSANLTNWQTGTAGILAGATRLAWKDTSSAERRFYRIAADVP